jgi:hypothetical protein
LDFRIPCRAQSAVDTPIGSSSPSKKNKRLSSNKSGTPPLNAPPSRTSSPNQTVSRVQASNPNGGSSSSLALSAQTQLASLRGALEAARLREEKHKKDMEKVVKELDTLKWESTNSRRGEVEVPPVPNSSNSEEKSTATQRAWTFPGHASDCSLHCPLHILVYTLLTASLRSSNQAQRASE